MLRRTVVVFVASAALAAPLALAGPAQASQDTTILDAVTAADRYTKSENENGLDRFRWSQRNWYDFDILTAAVVADGTLVPAVTDPSTAVTLFAPNDRAFQKLVRDLTGRWYWTEQKVLNAIVRLVDAGKVDLTNVLTYHVVPGKYTKAEVPLRTPIETLNGDTIKLKPKRFGIKVKDNMPDFRNPYLLQTDIDAGHSVIHSLTRVLIPTNVGGSS